jgi:hypothetical protein
VQQETQRELLQQIADDERRPAHERDAARRATATADQPTRSPRGHGRDANAPMTQADQDADIENSLRYDHQLTTQDRIEIERGLDPPTQAILAAFGSSLLWLFGSNSAEIQLLIDLHRRTHSDIVRKKASETIRWIADYSPIDSAKIEAQQFLTQLDTNERNT